jgi:hypothetical protein
MKRENAITIATTDSQAFLCFLAASRPVHATRMQHADITQIMFCSGARIGLAPPEWRLPESGQTGIFHPRRHYLRFFDLRFFLACRVRAREGRTDGDGNEKCMSAISLSKLSPYTSVIGTFLPCRICKRMSGVQGKPDVTRTSQK